MEPVAGVRLALAVLGVLVALAGAVLLGSDLAIEGNRAREALPIERDVAAALPPVFGHAAAVPPGTNVPVSELRAILPWRGSSDVTVPDWQPAARGWLAVLRDQGRLQVVDLDRRRVTEASLDPRVEEIAAVGRWFAVRVPGRSVMLVDPSAQQAVRISGLLPGARPERLLPAGGDLQVWGRREQGWSGVLLAPTDAGVEGRKLPALPSGAAPVAAGPEGVVADTGGTTLYVPANGGTQRIGQGTPLAVADEQIVRVACRPRGCAFIVGASGMADGTRITVDVDEVGDRLVAPRGVPAPGGRRVAVSLLLKYDTGWRPAVVDLDAARVDLLSGVLPRNSPTDAYAWSSDGHWLFAPLGEQVVAYSLDGQTRVVDLGSDGPIIDMAAG